jgi:hypothetical protein
MAMSTSDPFQDIPAPALAAKRQRVAHDAVFRVAEPCPYCGGELYAWTETWEERADGTLQAGCTMLVECDTQPDIDAKGSKWDYWMRQHSEMPYAYMLPICVRITRWVNARFDFDLNLDREPMSLPIGGTKPVPHIP